MSRKRDKRGDYSRASASEENNSFLGNVATRMGMRMYVRERETPTRSRYGVRGVALDDVCEPGDPRWQNVRMGHWIVGEQRVTSVGKRTVYICVSKCGCVATYEDWEIANGRLPQTCWACRVGDKGSPPPGHSTVPEKDVPALLEFWNEDFMPIVFSENHNLRGKEARDQWMKLGRPVLTDIVGRTNFGRDHGWKCFVMTCEPRSWAKSAERHMVRWVAMHKSTKSVEIQLQPANSDYGYTVQLACPRCDVDFQDVNDKIKAVIERHWPREETKPVPKAVAAAAKSGTVSEGNGHVSIVDLTKLARIGDNLTKLLALGKDINEMAGMKLVAAEKLKQAAERSKEAYVRFASSQNEEEDRRQKKLAHQERIAELEMKLRNEQAALAKESIAYDEVRDTKVRLEAEYESLADAAEQAKAELAELEKMEADQMKAVGDAKQLSVLLEALARIPG